MQAVSYGPHLVGWVTAMPPNASAYAVHRYFPPLTLYGVGRTGSREVIKGARKRERDRTPGVTVNTHDET